MLLEPEQLLFLGVPMRCSNCGSENPAGKKFCGDCGTSLDGRASMPVREPSGPLPGERRHLTVLFCDWLARPESRLDSTPRNGGKSSLNTIAWRQKPLNDWGVTSRNTSAMA